MSLVPSASEILRAQGIPHRRMEDWKYTDLRSAIDSAPVHSDWHAGLAISWPESVEVVGLEKGELPSWVADRIKVTSPSSAMDSAARSLIGVTGVFRVPAGAQVTRPLTIEHSGPGYGATVVFVEAGASITIDEPYGPQLNEQSDTSLLLFLAESARATLMVRAAFERELVLVETISVLQERNSRFRVHLLNGGAKLSRTELNITLAGEGAEADLSGVSVLGDGAHADITTRIVHAVPNTTSRQLFKYIAGGKSRAVYQGKITVKEGAIGSDSRQTAKALLLSNHAEADLKPELEILADDVKCAHGAAVGDLDADSLFYLRSRGIPEKEARALLIEAFLQEVVDGIEDETIRISAADFVKEGLARAMSETP
jgi:Fe-S cluster assembly protein SufD